MKETLTQSLIKNELASLLKEIPKVLKMSWDKYEAKVLAEETLLNKFNALDKRAGDGINIGRILQFPIADGYALYVITEIKPRSVKATHLPFSDAWEDNYSVSPNGIVSMRVAELNIRQRDGLRALFGRKSAV